MIEVITNEVSKHTMTEVLGNLLTDALGEEIKTKCKFIYPLNNIYIRKVKTVKKPKFDTTKLNELYKEAPESKGTKKEAGAVEDEASKNLLHKWFWLFRIYVIVNVVLTLYLSPW